MADCRTVEIKLLESDPIAPSVAHVDAAVEEVFTYMLRSICLVVEEELEGNRVQASIRMGGEHAAECCVAIAEAAGDRLTDAMLGTEADWDEEMIADAVGELCNMITGGIKRRLRLWCRNCRITLPKVERHTAGAPDPSYAESIHRVYCFGEDRIAVTLGFLAASERWHDASLAGDTL